LKTSFGKQCAALALVLLAGCAGRKVDVITNVDPAFDFSKARTYRWLNTPAATIFQNLFTAANVSVDELDARIKAAADAELAEKGFQKSEEAALILTYGVAASERMLSNPTPSTTDWNPTQDPKKYGSVVLALDFLDPATNTRIWRGAAMTDMMSGEGRERVQGVIVQILQEFPPKK